MQATGKGIRKAGASAVKGGKRLGAGGKKLGAITGKGGGLAKLKGAGVVGELANLKVGGDIASQLLKNPKLRWMAISKLEPASAGMAALTLVLLAPIITVGWILFSIMMSFRVSGKEWILLGVANSLFAFASIFIFASIAMIVCILNIECMLEAAMALIL